MIEAARQLGYRTNSAASATSTGRFNAVGLLMSQQQHQSTVVGSMLRGLHDAFAARGIHLTVTFVDDEHLTSDEHLPKILSHAMVDGLLLNYTHGIPDRMVELVARHNLPTVWINSKQPANCVYPDDDGAGYQATKLLLEAGHQRILYLDLTAGVEDAGEIHYSHIDRRAGYERAMREATLEPFAVVSTRRLTHRLVTDEAARILAVEPRPTAVVGYCRHDCDALLRAGPKFGLSVGENLSMVIIEHLQPLTGPKVDTLILPEFHVGHAAASMLLDRLDNPSTDQPAMAIPMTHQFGETVLPIRWVESFSDRGGLNVLP